jgi:hypothetical protein
MILTIENLKQRLHGLDKAKMTAGQKTQRSSLMRGLMNIQQDCAECGCSGSGLRLEQVDAFCRKFEA